MGLMASAPGRICLFGEHQDYLGLPVIAAAISLRIGVEGREIDEPVARISLPDIGSSVEFRLDEPPTYAHARDYIRSAVNVLRRAGCTWSRGCEATFRGTIPINAGTSSSSAMVVAWTVFMAAMSDQRWNLDPERAAHLAWKAEVEEFQEPGGKMDHYSSALGGVVFLTFSPEVVATRLHPTLGAFVLGNSGEPKDTTRILASVKHRVLGLSARLRRELGGFDLGTCQRSEFASLQGLLDGRERELIDGTLRNRDITLEARSLLSLDVPDGRAVGALMNAHQSVLRDVLDISTPTIDRMIDAALGAGALGAKINGSGGGGCMFAYAPDAPERVAEAIEQEGGTATIMRVDRGLTLSEGTGT
jgi:galactokinase